MDVDGGVLDARLSNRAVHDPVPTAPPVQGDQNR